MDRYEQIADDIQSHLVRAYAGINAAMSASKKLPTAQANILDVALREILYAQKRVFDLKVDMELNAIANLKQGFSKAGDRR